jgi:hypothetical protein
MSPSFSTISHTWTLRRCCSSVYGLLVRLLDDDMQGEKYGYGLTQPYGYSFITGGGGMILSRGGLDSLIVCVHWSLRKAQSSQADGCACQSIDDPDDMWLGLRDSLGLTCFIECRHVFPTDACCSDPRLWLPPGPAQRLSSHTKHPQPHDPQTYAAELLRHQTILSFHKCIKARDCEYEGMN